MTTIERGTTWRVLDHGWVQYDDHMGDDAAIVAAARTSTLGKRAKRSEAKLIDFLMASQHMSPFERPAITLVVRLPVFVMMQWHRHRTQSYSVESRRYTTLKDEVYVPDHHRVSSKGGLLNPEGYKDALWDTGRAAFGNYEDLINLGVPSETAGLHLPMNHYRTMTVTANLRNWLQFLALRIQPDAERPIREYARVIYHILDRLYPVTVAAWRRHVLGKLNLTAAQFRDALKGDSEWLELSRAEYNRIMDLYEWMNVAPTLMEAA